MTTERRHRRPPRVYLAKLSESRLVFRRWRRSRPFWAGLLTAAGAIELVMMPGLELGGVTIHQGVAGVASWLMAALMAFMAMVMWFQPHLRLIAGVATILFSLASFLTSNFGGFLIGMLLGLVGGSLAVAWDVGKPERQPVETADLGEPQTGETAAAMAPAEPVAPGPTQATAESSAGVGRSLSEELVGRDAEGGGD